MSSMSLTVAEFARVCQVTPRTIRWYQQKGLITPIKVDEWNKYAYFAPEQSLLVFQIKLLQQVGLPLREIRTKLSNSQPSLDKELKRLDEFIKQKQKEMELLKEINSIISLNKFNLREETAGPYKLFCYRIEKGDYSKLDAYINELRRVAESVKLKVLDKEITFYLDPELKYKPKNSNLEVALIISGQPKFGLPKLSNNYYFRDFLPTKALTFNFRGPSNYLSLVYNKIDKYVKEKEIRIKSPVFETYLKNAINTGSPYDYITKIAYPI